MKPSKYLLTLSLLLSSCASPNVLTTMEAQHIIDAYTIAGKPVEVWERKNGTQYLRFVDPDGKVITWDILSASEFDKK